MLAPLQLSVQLYSLRNIPHLADQLGLAHNAGLRHVEATSSNYAEVDYMVEVCRQYGLDVPSGHVGIDRLRTDFDGMVAVSRQLGMRTLVLWGLPGEEMPQTAAGWRSIGLELGKFAERLADCGIRFAFHNHDWELQNYEGDHSGLDLLFEGAGDARLFWQADLAWLARGKADVTALIDSHKARLISAHVKDLAPTGSNDDEDGWADLGEGRLPWKAWWPLLRRLKLELLVLEHDEPADPNRFLTRSTTFARQLEIAFERSPHD